MSALLQSAPKNAVTGQLVTVDGTSAPDYLHNGIPYDNGSVAVDSTGTTSHYHQGLPFTAAGRLKTTAAAPSYVTSGAANLSMDALCAKTAAITHYANGVAYSAGGSAATQGSNAGGVVILDAPASEAISVGATATFNVGAI